jgi:hypothetical protein
MNPLQYKPIQEMSVWKYNKRCFSVKSFSLPKWLQEFVKEVVSKTSFLEEKLYG